MTKPSLLSLFSHVLPILCPPVLGGALILPLVGKVAAAAAATLHFHNGTFV